jgi:hypothetical protein
MAGPPTLTPQQLDEHWHTLLDSFGCAGACCYTWTGTVYELTSGSCSGGADCPSCPSTVNGVMRKLVLKLRRHFPDPDRITVNCTIVLLAQPVLKLLHELAGSLDGSASSKATKLSSPTKKSALAKKSAPAKKLKKAR